ncbi:uncharacterized protein LOC115226398 [Argonauta hians]
MTKLPVSKLLLTLTIFTNFTPTKTITSNQRFNRANYKNIGPGYTYEYLQNSIQDYNATASNTIDCAGIALRNQSEFFTYNKFTKICQDFSPKNFLTVKKVGNTDQIAHYRIMEWIRIFSISMGTDSMVEQAFLKSGNPSEWKVTGNPGFFRHPLIDIWHQLPIEEVKLVLYKDEKPVVTMVFDGRYSTMKSWFTLDRVKISPWNDLLRNSNAEFLMDGGLWQFEIVYKDGSCQKQGWMIAVLKNWCSWDVSSHYPHIVYSAKQGAALWPSDTVSHADAMAIFLRLGNN